MARELVNRIQNIRKDSGFDVTDKVDVVIYADGDDAAEIESSLKTYKEYVSAQTLSLSVTLAAKGEATGKATEVEWNENTIMIAVTRR